MVMLKNVIVSALREEEKDPFEAPPGPYKLQPENQEAEMKAMSKSN